mmetsp:Transcript_20458/g.58160  ORF Transcript_20458/g.58160 Transcript_20458/m.58160 type:complete len:290 (+) Transcript_20458:500-1369(+)
MHRHPRRPRAAGVASAHRNARAHDGTRQDLRADRAGPVRDGGRPRPPPAAAGVLPRLRRAPALRHLEGDEVVQHPREHEPALGDHLPHGMHGSDGSTVEVDRPPLSAGHDDQPVLVRGWRSGVLARDGKGSQLPHQKLGARHERGGLGRPEQGHPGLLRLGPRLLPLRQQGRHGQVRPSHRGQPKHPRSPRLRQQLRLGQLDPLVAAPHRLQAPAHHPLRARLLRLDLRGQEGGHRRRRVQLDQVQRLRLLHQLLPRQDGGRVHVEEQDPGGGQEQPHLREGDRDHQLD